MRIDLFELIDGFFRGVVYFLYNIIATTARLLRHPLRAPSALFLLHRSKKRRQVGGTTFLFLVFFAFFALANFPVPGPDSPRNFLGGQVSPVEIDLQTFWPAILAALVSTTVADAALRLYLRVKLAGRTGRAEATLNMVEYSMLWLLLGAVALAFLAIIGEPVSQESPGAYVYPLAAILGLVAALLAPLPAVAVLQSGLRVKRSRAARFSRAWPSVILHGLMVWTIAFSALFAGVYLVIMPEMLRTWRVSDPAGKVRVIDLRCALSGIRPHADALLQNDTEQALLLYPRDIRVRAVRIVRVRSPGSGTASAELRDVALFLAADPDAEPILLPPGTAKAVRIGLRGNAPHALAAGERCRLSGADPGSDLFRGG